MRLKILAAALLATAGTADAAVITFDASNNGQSALTNSYQPLLAGYTGDGAALGITIGWGGTWSSTRSVNGGVTDHSTNGTGYVGFDNGAETTTITFDQAVRLPSLFFSNFGAGNYTIVFKGYTNIGDVNPVVTVSRSYSQPSGYTWIEETGLAGHNITAFSFTGGVYKQIDDITVTAIPEPATWALMIGGFAMTGVAMRRRKIALAA